jgi:2-furoyl-CoA dehydrogenase large subunit
MRLREKLARTAAAQLNVPPAEIESVDGKVRASGNPDNAIPFGRLAAGSHWAPATIAEENQALRETVFWTPPELTAPTEADEVNSSLCHGFIFDFCGVEIDRTTGAVRIDKYVTMHDCGPVLHPGMVAGQITGGFAQAVGAALLEEYAYAPDGSYLTGTFADYLLPTAMEVPAPVILHIETPSPFTPLGAKGVGEGNCMSTPVCIANAVADALGCTALDLPLTPSKLLAASVSASTATAPVPSRGHRLHGAGEAAVGAPPDAIWRVLLDPEALARALPGAHRVERLSPTRFRADLTLGIGPISGRHVAEIDLSDLVAPSSAALSGTASGSLGFGRGAGRLRLVAEADGTRLVYSYEGEIGGKAAAIGGRLLDAAARLLVGRFFEALGREAGGEPPPGLLGRIRRRFDGRA